MLSKGPGNPHKADKCRRWGVFPPGRKGEISDTSPVYYSPFNGGGVGGGPGGASEAVAGVAFPSVS